MVNVSDVTGITYDEEEMVYFRNILQIAFYIEHGVKVYDLFTDSKGKLVFVFKRDDHNKMIKLWMENKDKNKEQ